jgi:hypothetical protein
MGARLRLKAAKDISGFTPEVQRIFRAMKRYGLIVADNGSDMYVTGTMDSRWNNDALNPAFRALTADDFEVIVLGWEGLRTRGSGRGARASGTATAFRGTTGTTQRGLRGNARTTARAATRGSPPCRAPSAHRR